MERIGKTEYYLDIAEAVGKRSTCERRMYGAVLVQNDEIISTGYNGAPRGDVNCSDLGYCKREALNVPKGERYELCVAVHAEMNCIISASRRDMLGATLYIIGREKKEDRYASSEPCLLCQKLIKNAGIKKIIGRNSEGEITEYNIWE